MEFFKLNNGTQMPMAGIDVFTFIIAENSNSPKCGKAQKELKKPWSPPVARAQGLLKSRRNKPKNCE